MDQYTHSLTQEHSGSQHRNITRSVGFSRVSLSTSIAVYLVISLYSFGSLFCFVFWPFNERFTNSHYVPGHSCHGAGNPDGMWDM